MLTRLQQQALTVMNNANLKGHANERKDTCMFFIMFLLIPCVFFALKMRSFFAHRIVGPYYEEHSRVLAFFCVTFQVRVVHDR
jgi:heme/copper-type cytochrome/quinol oxidase subunit 3